MRTYYTLKKDFIILDTSSFPSSSPKDNTAFLKGQDAIYMVLSKHEKHVIAFDYVPIVAYYQNCPSWGAPKTRKNCSGAPDPTRL